MSHTDFAIKIAKQAGELILEECKKGFKVDLKGKNDLVTNVDKAVEEFLVSEINKEYPDHAILAEENDYNDEAELSKAPYIWIIDPIDGTTNFAHGLPQFAISIGLFKRESSKSSQNYDYMTGELVAGVIYAPKMNELYHAEKGKGAFLNNEKIEVSKVDKVENSLLVTGFPTKNRKQNLPYFESLLGNCQAIRRLGSASLDLAYVAAGRFEAFWEFGLSPWDIAAGTLIVAEAGGKITDTNGNLLDLFGKDILASNGPVHQEIVDHFKDL